MESQWAGDQVRHAVEPPGTHGLQRRTWWPTAAIELAPQKNVTGTEQRGRGQGLYYFTDSLGNAGGPPSRAATPAGSSPPENAANG